MIDHISINDFAIIKKSNVDFGPGLSIITGETGAGKSIVIEAISLALGARANSSYVRRGCDKAKIQLIVSSESEDHILSREISAQGKNICRFDGELLYKVSNCRNSREFAAIHGQYDNQSLLDPANHLALVDSYHKSKISPIKAEFTKAYEEYKDVKSKLNNLISDMKENQRQKDYYQFQVAEIDTVNPQPGEDQELEDKISILKNGEKIFNAANISLNALSEGECNVLSMLGEASDELGSIKSYSSKLDDMVEKLNDFYYGIEDISSEIKDLIENTNFEPEKIDKAINRLDSISHLKKKYSPDISEILKIRDEALTKLERIGNFNSEKAELDAKVKTALSTLKEKTLNLSEARILSAEELSRAIEDELHDLNFNDAKLEIEVRKAENINSTGGDECEIMISTNKGEPLKPLTHTASGGEISRIMLAIRNICADYDNIPTMIFDEIDAGISGITASVVARKLKEISSNHQIICITHLPQIAAAGDTNYRIYKDTDSDSTFTHIEKLNEDAKVEEIARLLGGDNITETTLKSARELIAGLAVE